MNETAARSGDRGITLLTGASGYVGGRLLRELERSGHRVRCTARNPAFLRERVPSSVDVVHGDVLDAETLPAALHGVHTAYYLIHSMGSTGDFERQDRAGAENFARAARTAGAKRIIYLGGLGHGDDLSRHLRSRHEVGRILRESGVPTVELRASIVIGSGSLSFEMIRALVDKLPVMITPQWVHVAAQPISIEDLVSYLLEAAAIPFDQSTVFEIGGPDRVSYGEVMREYARQRGLRRIMIPVPVLSPRLSSRWLGLVTPLYARIGRKLLDSVRNETIVRDTRALEVFPIRPRGIREAIQRALVNEDHDFAQTRWSDALSSKGRTQTWGGVTFGSRVVDSRAVSVSATPSEAFEPIRQLGGRVGWYFADWLWHLRGFLDLLVGGVGMRRGRRHPRELRSGDAVDFWRVERIQPPRLLLLQAEMRLPGRAWLQFEIEPTQAGSTIRQTAIFDPVGLFGRLYWYVLYPAHVMIFRGMLRRIARAATRVTSAPKLATADSSKSG